MKMNQISFYAANTTAAFLVKKWFGLQDAHWIEDTVTAQACVYNAPAEENIAELQFNEDLGIQLEIIRYIHGPHWCAKRPDFGNYIISHIGVHLDEGEPWPEMKFMRLAQHSITTKHTAAHFNDPKSPAFGRTYEYKIYELTPTTFIKFIRRIHHG